MLAERRAASARPCQSRRGTRSRGRARRCRGRRPRARGRRSSAGRRARGRRWSIARARRARRARPARAPSVPTRAASSSPSSSASSAAARRRRRRRVHAVDDACRRTASRPRAACGGRRSPPRPGRAAGEVTIRNVVAGSVEQRADAPRALGEAVDHPAERAEEHRQVLQQVDAGDALEHREHDAGAAAEISRRSRGPQEDPDRAALEEAREPAGRVEEVERVARRRRVEHEQVVVALLVELVELGDRGELLRAGDRARELLVDAVGEHLVARAPRRARGAR